MDWMVSGQYPPHSMFLLHTYMHTHARTHTHTHTCTHTHTHTHTHAHTHTHTRTRTRTHRFNIVFYNAGGVYFLRHHLLRYLENVCHTCNKLLQAVYKDFKHPLYLIGCRALGIVSKCITAPLWRILESPLPMNILGKEYQRVHRCFLKWSDDASTEGLGSVDEDDVYRDRAYESYR